MLATLGRSFSFEEAEAVSTIHFYGAGCATAVPQQLLKYTLAKVMPNANISVDHDLLGAARGIFGYEAGLVCILGTGSHACCYNGERIEAEAVNVGYLLTDEGSGGRMGKDLLTAYYRNALPSDLAEALAPLLPGSVGDVIQVLYRQPYSNRFLASFAPFLAQHIDHPYVKELCAKQFEEFVHYRVKPLLSPKSEEIIPIGVVGSVAKYFAPLVQEAFAAAHLSNVRIEQSPLAGLIRYHKEVAR
jgi:glucosamine kinase